MPSTTNFNWTTPADTDLVKDGAAAIRTLGNGIDTSFIDLKGGTTGQVLSKATNTDLDFSWVTPNDADAIQNTIVDAKGDLISATAADTPARLASSGVNGQVLTIDTSTSTGLKWATPAAGGKILQVIMDSSTTSEDFQSTSYTDSDLSATITPSSASSKILVFFACQIQKLNADYDGAAALVRTSTIISELIGLGSTESTARARMMAVMNILDTPNTTSAVTYKVQFKTSNAAHAFRTKPNSSFGSLILMEVAA